MSFKILPEEPKQSTFSRESVHRLPAQAIKGAAAAIPGVLGDLASTLHTFVAKPIAETITGKEEPVYEQSMIGKLLPTTATHKKRLEEGLPYLKPKNKVEKFIGDIGEDAVSLFIPGSILNRVGLRGTSALNALTTSVGANAAGEAVRDLTGDDTKAAYAKMGTMFLLSAVNKPRASEEITNLYRQSDHLLPPNATVNATRLQNEMNQIRNQVLQGRQLADLAPSEQFVVNEADTILRQINNGQANVGTLSAATRSLNENLQRAVYAAPNQATRVRARRLATQINRNVNNTLSDYGRQNPQWWQTRRSANEAFGTLQQSNFISNFIQNNVIGNPVTHGLLHAFGIGAATATGIVPYQAARLIYQISRSPTLARHYARVVSSAASENASLMNKEIKILDDKMKKEEEAHPKFKILD